MSRVRQLLKGVTAPVDSMVVQVPRALIVSLLALGLDVVLYELLIRQFAIPAVPSAIAGYLAGGVVQYVLCSLWVFPDSPTSVVVGFAAFTLLSLVGLGITCVIVYFVHDVAGANELLAKIVAVGAAFTWNFLSRKLLLFRPSAGVRGLESPAAVSTQLP